MNRHPEHLDFEALSEKILEGIRKATRKLVEVSASKGEDIVIGEPNGSCLKVPAKELLKSLPR